MLVPVPVHAERARRRGYDQAELIARSVAAELGLPCAPILERARATIAQFDLDRSERSVNVRGAFQLKPRPTARAPAPVARPAADARQAPGTPPALDARPAPDAGPAPDARPAADPRPDARACPDERAPADQPLAGRWVVLIDDVVTTGATLAECAAPLLQAGALGVSAITVARER